MHIFQAAQEVLTLAQTVDDTPKTSVERIQHIRKKHPRAYEKWSQEEEKQLKDYFEAGKSIRQICKLHQRQPGAIKSRLKKLGLIEDVE